MTTLFIYYMLIICLGNVLYDYLLYIDSILRIRARIVLRFTALLRRPTPRHSDSIRAARLLIPRA